MDGCLGKWINGQTNVLIYYSLKTLHNAWVSHQSLRMSVNLMRISLPGRNPFPVFFLYTSGTFLRYERLISENKIQNTILDNWEL